MIFAYLVELLFRLYLTILTLQVFVNHQLEKGPIIFCVLLVSVSILKGQEGIGTGDNTPKYSNEFLNIGVGPRHFGMGLTAVSYVDDATSGYWNPAGLLGMEVGHQLMLMHASYFAGIANYDFGAFATALDEDSRLGISLMRFSVDDIADTRFLFDANGAVNYDNIRFFSASDYAFLISYARKLPWADLPLGGNVKIIHRKVGSFATAWGFGIDLGVQRDFGKWNIGLMAKDISGTFNTWSHNTSQVRDVYIQTGNSIPINTLEITLPRLIAGVARDIDISPAFDLLISADFVNTFDGKRNTLIRSEWISIDPMVGLEIGFKELAFLRGGINQFQQIKDFDGDKSWIFQPSMGVGLKLQELTIDYAFTDIGDQAAGLYSHVFSIKVDFKVEDQ